MPWDRLVLAVVIAFVSALAFYPAIRLGHQRRTFVWLGCSAIVGLSPCLIPLDATPLRFFASLFAINLLVKLYDVHQQARFGLHLSLSSYLAYLPNGFWLVLSRKPNRPAMSHDLRCLGLRAPAALLSAIVCLMLFQVNWPVSFALEHVVKVFVVVSVVVLTTNALASGYRLLGGAAIDFMSNPLMACTPADFWRRWNVPAQQFLNEYAFKPAGGLRKPFRATLITFAISGIVHEYVFSIASGRVQVGNSYFSWFKALP